MKRLAVIQENYAFEHHLAMVGVEIFLEGALSTSGSTVVAECIH